MTSEEYEKLYENDGPVIQSQIVQLFNWLSDNAVNILIKIVKLMNNVHIEWNELYTQLFPIILSTIPENKIDDMFDRIMKYI